MGEEGSDNRSLLSILEQHKQRSELEQTRLGRMFAHHPSAPVTAVELSSASRRSGIAILNFSAPA
ncbi:hypothetical protein C5E10_15845 [Pseudoclavibacter sp. RFBG4]|nr:hypothetical protein C5E10_15845 [Pseudoclavibacter sp. RFBG4]